MNFAKTILYIFVFLWSVFLLPFGVEIWQTSKLYFLVGVVSASCIPFVIQALWSRHRISIAGNRLAVLLGGFLGVVLVSFAIADNWYRDLVGILGTGFHHSLGLMIVLGVLYVMLTVYINKKDIRVLMFLLLLGNFVSNLVFLISFSEFGKQILIGLGSIWDIQLSLWQGINPTSASLNVLLTVQILVMFYVIGEFWFATQKIPNLYKAELWVFFVQAFMVFLLKFSFYHLVLMTVGIGILALGIVVQDGSKMLVQGKFSLIPKINSKHSTLQRSYGIVGLLIFLIVVSGWMSRVELKNFLEIRVDAKTSVSIIEQLYKEKPLRAVIGYGPTSVRNIWLDNVNQVSGLDPIFVKSNDVLFAEILNILVRYGVLGGVIYVSVLIWVMQAWLRTLRDTKQKQDYLYNVIGLLNLVMLIGGFFVVFDVVLWVLLVILLAFLVILSASSKIVVLDTSKLTKLQRLSLSVGGGMVVILVVSGLWYAYRFYLANITFADALKNQVDLSSKITYAKKASELNPWEEVYQANYMNYRTQELSTKLEEAKNIQEVEKLEDTINAIKEFTTVLENISVGGSVDLLRAKWDGYKMLLGYVEVEYQIFQDMLELSKNMKGFEMEFVSKMANVQLVYIQRTTDQAQKTQLLTEAQKLLENVRSRQNFSGDEVLMYAEILKMQGKIDLAIDALNQYIDTKTTQNNVVEVSVMTTLAQLYTTNDRLAEAKLVLDKVISEFPLNSNGLYLYGEILLKENDKIGARQYFEQVLQINPENEALKQKIKDLE